MPKSSSKVAELIELTIVRPPAHSGRDAKGRILPGSVLTPTHFRPERPCEGFECGNFVPAGMVVGQQKKSFCSPECRNSFRKHEYFGGRCKHCGEPFYTAKGQVGVVKYCSREHRVLAETDALHSPMGPFRSMVENYLATVGHYRGKTLTSVKVALVAFFSYVHTVEGIVCPGQVKSSVVTRFNAMERDRGITTTNSICFVSMFFKHMMAEDDSVVLRNPVINTIHNQKRVVQAPRPYKDEDLNFIWDIVEERNCLSLMLAFRIGEECGLRVGEVCNIRLEDVDLAKQTIFVRLPTKNMETRTVRYHDKVAALLPRWLSQRSVDCKHDHLLHTVRRASFTNNSLDTYYRNLFSDRPAPANGFSFHRLRHTWATRLMNNGMDLAVLMKLGGWKAWDSMRRYIEILPSTIKAEYEESYRKLQTMRSAPEEPTLSLTDFASLGGGESLDSPRGLTTTLTWQ